MGGKCGLFGYLFPHLPYSTPKSSNFHFAQNRPNICRNFDHFFLFFRKKVRFLCINLLKCQKTIPLFSYFLLQPFPNFSDFHFAFQYGLDTACWNYGFFGRGGCVGGLESLGCISSCANFSIFGCIFAQKYAVFRNGHFSLSSVSYSIFEP